MVQRNHLKVAPSVRVRERKSVCLAPDQVTDGLIFRSEIVFRRLFLHCFSSLFSDSLFILILRKRFPIIYQSIYRSAHPAR